jgi:hypothetical protein
MACDISTTEREKSLSTVSSMPIALNEFAAPVGAPILGTTVMPPFRRISLPHRTIKSTLSAAFVRRGRIP